MTTAAVAEAIVRFSALAANVGDLISKLDVNPLIAGRPAARPWTCRYDKIHAERAGCPPRPPEPAPAAADRQARAGASSEGSRPGRNCSSRWMGAASCPVGRSRADARALFGDIHLDLREVIVHDDLAEISALALAGNLCVDVPEGVEVELTGFDVLGDREGCVDAKGGRFRPASPRRSGRRSAAMRPNGLGQQVNRVTAGREHGGV
jgi:hypothetical protein